MRLATTFLFISCAATCPADAIYHLAGTYGSGAIDTELITPGKAFTASFTIPEPVAPFNFSSNQSQVSVAVNYVLDGATLTAYTPHVTLWTGGGFSLILWESNGINRVRLNYGGPVMFTGPTSAPVLNLPWSLGGGGASWSYHAGDGSIIASGSLSAADATTVPEPGSLALAALGLYFALGVMKRTRRGLAPGFTGTGRATS